MTDLVLLCHGINEIDASGLEVLKSINERLNSQNIKFPLVRGQRASDGQVKIESVSERILQGRFSLALRGNVHPRPRM